MKIDNAALNKAGSEFSEKLFCMQGMDAFRLCFKYETQEIPDALRRQIDHLYNFGHTQQLIASILDAILSFKKSTFLLSRSDCQDLINANPKITKKFSIECGGKNRPYAGLIAEMDERMRMVDITIVSNRKPMIVDVIDPYILGVIGKSPEDYRKRVYFAVEGIRKLK